eukprot:6470160-Amphidinium_carterae.2
MVQHRSLCEAGAQHSKAAEDVMPVQARQSTMRYVVHSNTWLMRLSTSQHFCFTIFTLFSTLQVRAFQRVAGSYDWQ